MVLKGPMIQIPFWMGVGEKVEKVSLFARRRGIILFLSLTFFFLMIIILEYFSPTTGQLRVTVEIELQRSGKPKFLHH